MIVPVFWLSVVAIYAVVLGIGIQFIRALYRIQVDRRRRG